MSDKIMRIPITTAQRRKNSLGPLYVECQVTGRALRFHEQTANFDGREFITVDVIPMGFDDENPSKKICSVVVTREDLLNALKHVSVGE